MKAFAGFSFRYMDIPLGLIDASVSQPKGRNDMDLARRQALLEDMRKNGQKDAVDAIVKANGRYELVEGNGRVLAARELGWKTVQAKVYDDVESDEKRAQLRNAIFLANGTSMKMTSAHWTEYALAEHRLGNEVDLPSKVRDYVDFLVENFTAEERKGFMKDGVGVDYLQTSRLVARKILGFDVKGKYPQDSEAKMTLLKCFRWNVKHRQQRAVIESSSAGLGAKKFAEAVEKDEPLPLSKKKQELREKMASASAT